MEAIVMFAQEARGEDARGKERSRGRAGGERRTSAGTAGQGGNPFFKVAK